MASRISGGMLPDFFERGVWPYEGVIHDFVMLNALRETNAAEAAINQAITFLRNGLGLSR